MSKKILAVLICCALALGSVFCFAGCDNKESELQALRQSTENLQQSNEELKQSLTELQEILKKQNEQIKNLEDENKQLLEKSELYDTVTASKSFYTLTVAYEKSMLSYYDLLNLAYYNNDGRRYNEEIIAEDFKPAQIIPNELNMLLQNAIKRTYINVWLQKLDKVVPTIEDVEIIKYFGTFNGCVAVTVRDNFSGVAGVETGDYVAGVRFVYSSPADIIYIWG